MSFELTIDEALMVYEAIADHAWDSDLGKLATRIYTHCYPDVVPDGFLQMLRRAVLTMFPNMEGYEGYGNQLSYATCWVSRKETTAGRRTLYTKLVRPVLEYLTYNIPVEVDPTHFDIGIVREEDGWRITVSLYKL